KRLPRHWAERNRIEEATCPIRRNDLAFRSFQEYRIEVVRVRIEASDDLVVASHDRAENGPHLILSLKYWFIAAPDHRQPFARLDQLGADGDTRQEAIQIGQ